MRSLHEIVRETGGTLYAGGTRALIPGPGHSKFDRSLSLMENDEGRIIWFSYANDPSNSIRQYLGIPAFSENELDQKARNKIRNARQKAERAERERKSAFCAEIWDRAQPANGSPVQHYLNQARAIPIRDIPPAIRYHPRAPRNYARTAFAPAMVSVVTNTLGAPSGLHLTFLADDLAGHAGRIMLGQCQSGAVRLFPATNELAVCEGVETALSFSYLENIPTWAVLSTSGLASFRPAPEIDQYTMAIDRDDFSKAHPRGAALEIAEKVRPQITWAKTIIAPAPVNMDWNDHLRASK